MGDFEQELQSYNEDEISSDEGEEDNCPNIG
jgi:hypothetical protein